MVLKIKIGWSNCATCRYDRWIAVLALYYCLYVFIINLIKTRWYQSDVCNVIVKIHHIQGRSQIWHKESNLAPVYKSISKRFLYGDFSILVPNLTPCAFFRSSYCLYVFLIKLIKIRWYSVSQRQVDISSDVPQVTGIQTKSRRRGPSPLYAAPWKRGCAASSWSSMNSVCYCQNSSYSR